MVDDLAELLRGIKCLISNVVGNGNVTGLQIGYELIDQTPRRGDHIRGRGFARTRQSTRDRYARFDFHDCRNLKWPAFLLQSIHEGVGLLLPGNNRDGNGGVDEKHQSSSPHISSVSRL